MYLLQSYLLLVIFCCSCHASSYSNTSFTNLISELDLDQSSDSGSIAALKDLAYTRSQNHSNEVASALACGLGQALFAQTKSNNSVPSFETPLSSGYSNRTQVNWSEDCWLPAACIFSPAGTQDVSKIMKIVNFSKSKFAIRSGGHNPNVGFGGVGRNGVLIDMVNINAIQLSQDGTTVGVGPGQRLGQVYDFLDKTGRYVNGGKDPNPGVGGVLLGGGITFLASQYGMAANGINNIEAVLTNGSIINANSSSNSDFLWAVKGGGPNYGVITRYDLQAVQSPQVWWEYRIYDSQQIPALINATYQYQTLAEKDDYSSLVFQSFEGQTIMGYIYFKPQPYPPIFNAFYNISYQQTLVKPSQGSMAQLVKSTAGAASEVAQRYGHSYATYSVALKPDLGLYHDTYSTFISIAKNATQAFNGTVSYGLQPVTSNTVKQTQRNGGLPLNLAPGPQTWFVTTVEYTNEQDGAQAQAALKAVGKAVEAAADKKNIRLPFIFMNDANYDQKVLTSYGSQNLQRLQAVAKRYDPAGVLQQQQNGGFLVSKS